MKHGTALPRFLFLYAALFAAFGVASPFLPGLLEQDGLTSSAVGIVLAGGTAIRLAAGPFGGRLADRGGRPSVVLAGFTAAAALVALGYVTARGLALLLAVSLVHAAVLAPLTPVADALALGSASAGRGFAYGWVRGAGSAAFIAGTLLSGQLVERHGLGVVVWLNAGLLALAACAAAAVPDRLGGVSDQAGANQAETNQAGANQAGANQAGADRAGAASGNAMVDLLRVPTFGRLMLVVALIGGSHALHDGFEVIRWRAAGLSAPQCSVLWALSVASEVVVFTLAGAPLIRLLGTRGAFAVSALAGMLRWGTAALTARFGWMALVEPLHGLTFALLHLTCMQVIAGTVPSRLAATAQAFYATVAMGATPALVTLLSGSLYGRFGSGAFWAMLGMCAASLPLLAGGRGRAPGGPLPAH